MQDCKFRAELHSAQFTTRKDDTKKVLRRVKFALVMGRFDVHVAEWLGNEAIGLRKLLQSRSLRKFDLPIDSYFASVKFESTSGNADAEVAGLNAVAVVAGKDEDEHEEITLTFEAFPTAKLLTWIAASLKEWVEVDMVASQLELFERAVKGEGLRHAVESFKATIPAGTTVTMSGPDGVEHPIEGAGQ